MSNINDRELPFVSIAVITKDRRADLALLFRALDALVYPRNRFEVVVVEEADEDLATPWPAYLRYIRIPRRNLGYGYARNRVIKECRHPLIAFLDDDCQPFPDWLACLVPHFEDEKVAGVAGAVLTKDTTAIGYAEVVLGFPGGGVKRIAQTKGDVAPTRFLSTCNCAYRKAVLDEVGGFQADASEDYELAERITTRYACLYTTKAKVYHKARGNLKAIFWWFFRRGRQQVYLIRAFKKDRASRMFWNLTTSFILRVFIGLALATAIGGWFGSIFLAALYYGVLVRRFAYGQRYFNVPGLNFVVPLVKITMDVAFDCGKAWQLGVYALRGPRARV